MAAVTAGAVQQSPARHVPPSAIAAALIALHAALLVWSAMRNSVAFDEYAHLPAGVAYWHGGFSIYDHSPPLLRMIAATPLVLAGGAVDAPPPRDVEALPAKDRHWVYAEQFLRRNTLRYHFLFELGRLPMIVVSCCGAWIVFRWAGALYGPAGGLLSCAVYAICPNLLAHGSLVGTDSGTAVAVLLAAWLWWRYCRAPTKASLAWAAVAVALAHLCKFTAILLWPMLAAMAVCMLRSNGAWRRAVTGLAVCGATTLLIVNAGYAFEGTGRRVRDYTPQSKAVGWIFAHVPSSLPIPLPHALVEGFDAQKWEFEQGLASFLFGRQYAGSRWYYYPAVLLFKTPVATLALLAIALALRKLSRDEAGVLAALAIFLPGAIFFAGADLGVRYVLPAFPLAFVLIGRIARTAPLVRWANGLLLVLAIESAWVAPHYLSFVNILAGGPTRGQFVVNDSNFDWGTDLIALRNWMRGHGVARITLAYFGRVDPAVYGVGFDLPGEPNDDPYVAISSHFLVGMQGRLQSPRGPTGWFSIPFHRQLQDRTPVASVGGGSIRIYHREDLDAAARQFQFELQMNADERR